MKTLAVIALKGGSGKTTVATHLALAAHLRGMQALLVDTDPQHSARDILETREGGGPQVAAASARNVLVHPECQHEVVLKADVRPGFANMMEAKVAKVNDILGAPEA